MVLSCVICSMLSCFIGLTDTVLLLTVTQSHVVLCNDIKTTLWMKENDSEWPMRCFNYFRKLFIESVKDLEGGVTEICEATAIVFASRCCIRVRKFIVKIVRKLRSRRRKLRP